MNTDRQSDKLVEQDIQTRNADHNAVGMRRISSIELLGGQREIVIEHSGEEYRLRMTGKGKLILTK